MKDPRPYTPSFLADKLMRPAEEAGEKVKRITMNLLDYADIRKFGRDVLDLVTETEVLKTGYMADIFGVQLHVNKNISSGNFKLETEKNAKILKREYCVIHGLNFIESYCQNIDCIARNIHES